MKNHTGRCHCGNVEYMVDINLEEPVMECNCSLCSIKGILWALVPKDSFTLVKGEDSLHEYLFNKQAIRHQFCTTCGVEPFAYGVGPDGNEIIAINVRSITDVDYAALTKTAVDGKSF